MYGVIESFSVVDAIGSIRLDDGGEVRFGRSACPFEPALGTRVAVVGTTPGFRGVVKATRVELAEGRTVHAQRLGERDAALGATPPTLDGASLAATAREIGGLTVLLDDAVPRERGALLGYLLGLGLERHGITVDGEGSSFVFDVRGARVRAAVSHDPYPMDQVRCTGAPPQPGRSAITLLFSFMPRAYFTKAPDAWRPLGHARAMSRLALALAARGRSIIVHRADEMLVSRERFAARIGDLDVAESVPFAAWIEIGQTPDGGLASRGLRAFGLPEVRVEGASSDGWFRARRFEAVLFAAYCLCREQWIEDGLFEVPRRIQIGAGVPRLLDPVDVERWDARAEGAGCDLSGNVAPIELVLRHRPDSDDVVARWERASWPGAADPRAIGHGGYEALYMHAFMDMMNVAQAGMFAVFEHHVPHRVITLHADGASLVTTSGIGRVVQPAGERARMSDHVEILAVVPDGLASTVAEIVASVARSVHDPARTIALQPWGLLPTELCTFMMVPRGPVPMGRGVPITLLEMMPLDAAALAIAQAEPDRRAALATDRSYADAASRWLRVPGLPALA